MIYLNNAATSYPKPKEVIDTVKHFLDEIPCHSARAGIEREDGDVDYACRQKLANLFNVDDPFRIVFTSGSTEALNLAIKGVISHGVHVVSTKIEHNSVIRPLKTLEEEGIIEVDFVDCDSDTYVEPEAIKKAIKKNTKAVVINHSSNVTSQTLDVKAISEIAHEAGAIFILDASQSAGTLPIDVKEMNIDLLAFTGHKSLFGLQGSGGLYISPNVDPKPLKVGGTGVLSEVLTQPKGMPLYYEAGTPNLPGIISLGAGVDFINKTGMSKIREHKTAQVKRMIKELEGNPMIKIYTRGEHNSYSNFCFNIEGVVPEEVGFMLESSYGILVRTGLHCAPLLLEALGVHPWGTVRASPSFFTTDEEVTKFIASINEMTEFFAKHIA
jgi:cysteine desulfurase family protein